MGRDDRMATPATLETLLRTARQAALEAGAAIQAIYACGEIEVILKPDDSPLTRADKAAHDIISRRLAATGLPVLSEEGVHTSYAVRAAWPWYWLVDPLDGTKEFLKRNGEFTVNIALMQRNRPVAGVVFAPCLNTLYYGSKQTGIYKEEGEKRTQLAPLPHSVSLEALLQKADVTVVASRSHRTPETERFINQFRNVRLLSMGSSLKLMLLAEGKADIYPRFAPTMEWDTAASHAILKALNRGIYLPDLKTELIYNKPELLNPFFVAL